MPRAALVAVACIAAACAGAPPPDDAALAAALDRMIDEAAGPRVQVSALAVALDDGRTVYARDAFRRARPASTMKLLTVAAALAQRLEREEVSTRLFAAAPDGRELVLVGGGDPLLSTADLEHLAAALRRERPAGAPPFAALAIDDALFAGPRFGAGWMWDDEPDPDMPHLSALTVDGACIEVSVRGGDPLPEVTVAPGGLALEVRYEEHASGAPAIDRAWERLDNTLVIRAPAPGETARRRMTVVDPALQAGKALAAILEREGLLVRGAPIRRVGPEAKAGGRLAAAVARPWSEAIVRLLKESDNLAAECLLRRLAPAADGAPATADAGLDAVRAYLEGLGLPPSEYRVADGSGLSHYGLLSCDLLVTVLEDLHRQDAARALLARALPVAGEDGTLARRLRGTPAAGRVRAKTGTLSGVSNLAGYVETAGGRTLAFALMVEGYVGPAAPWRDLQDRFAAALAASDVPETPAR